MKGELTKMHLRIQAEYIWLGGTKEPSGIQQLRSKTRIVKINNANILDISDIIPQYLPWWSFDGSSTGQAKGNMSDCLLKPVRVFPDPLRDKAILVLCEVYNWDRSIHSSNKRAYLVEACEKYQEFDPLCGIEQEYTLFNANSETPFGWPDKKVFTEEEQGPFYCSVGANVAFGRRLIENHAMACLNMGLALDGMNAEVMPSQWEFQLGPLDPLKCADQLWIARWLLKRLGEDLGIEVSFDPKPKTGLNGAGAHTHFSTKQMRDHNQESILDACKKLGFAHTEHIKVYGDGNERRLTGKYETCSIDEFRFGNRDRTASVRIPQSTEEGELPNRLEDRRPAANMDPYLVLTALLETVCGNGFHEKSPKK